MKFLSLEKSYLFLESIQNCLTMSYMKLIAAVCSIIIASSFCAKAQTPAWTYTWANSGVNFATATGGVICFPSTNGITAASVTDAKTNSALLWLNPKGGLIRTIKFSDMNVTGFLFASSSSVVMVGYDRNYKKTLIRKVPSIGSVNTLTNDGFYPNTDTVPSAFCDPNFPASFADPRQLANYVNQNGFTSWTITSTNSATIRHYTLP